MKKILAFAGSNSSTSINHKWVSYVADQISSHPVDIISLRNFEMPLYSEDLEKSSGIPDNTQKLNQKIEDYDYLLISVNEHNGALSAFFKNCMDWLSRNDRNFLKGKKLFITSTSQGRGAAKMANDYAVEVLPRFGAEIVSSFALASFGHSFSKDKGFSDDAQKQDFENALQTFIQEID